MMNASTDTPNVDITRKKKDCTFGKYASNFFKYYFLGGTGGGGGMHHICRYGMWHFWGAFFQKIKFWVSCLAKSLSNHKFWVSF